MKPEKMSHKSTKKFKPAKEDDEVSVMMMRWSFWARRLYRGYQAPQADKADS
jgi:hypothetical protein